MNGDDHSHHNHGVGVDGVDDDHSSGRATNTPSQPPNLSQGSTPAVNDPDNFTGLTALVTSYLAPSTNAAPEAASNTALDHPMPVRLPNSADVLSRADPHSDIDMADPDDSSSHPNLPPTSSQSEYSPASTISATASPAPTSLRASRRARVEDDIDEEDSRETNRQRVHSPPTGPEPHLRSDLPPASVESPAMPSAHNTSHQDAPPAVPNAAPPQNNTGPHRIIFDFVLGSPFAGLGVNVPHAAHDHQPQDHHQHEHQPGAPNPQPGQGVPHIFNLGQFFNQMHGQPGFFDMLFGGLGPVGEEPDDPERAKRLLDGLEEVPVGLVKRLQRVGGDGDADAGPGCAVCWESLLDGDGGFGDDAQTEHTADTTPASQEDQPTASTSTFTPSPDGEKKYPKVVVLPCSHVFHASCLLPWFTRAHRTTCPSCRFDIDPDSLTYVPRPIRPVRSMPRRARHQQGHGQASATTPATPAGQAPQLTAGGASPSPVTAAGSGSRDDMGYNYFVVDLVQTGNEEDPREDAHAHDQPPQAASPMPDAEANSGNAQEEEPAPPPYGYVDFDISMAFSLVGPPHVNGPPGPGHNAGAAHFHLPYVFGGSFTVPGGQLRGVNAQPPVFGPAPSQSASNVSGQPTGAQPSSQPGDADPRAMFQRMFSDFFGQATAQHGGNVPAAPAASSTTAAAAQVPPLPSRSPIGTAGRGPVPPPPTFAQFFQQLFPGIQIPQARTGAAQQQHFQPAPQPSNPPVQAQEPNANANRAPGNLTPEERRAMASFFAALVPGIHFTPTPGQSGDGAANANATNNSNINAMPSANAPLFAFGAPPAPPTADDNDDPSTNPLNLFNIGPIPMPMPGPQNTATGRRARASSAPHNPSAAEDASLPPLKPQWVLPPPPGLTLRQRVEKREREMGLRCSDVSCGLGPTDDDPEPIPGVEVAKIRQIGIHKPGASGEKACEHRFHLACLVSAERVAGWGGDEEKNDNEEAEVEVSCPVCRAVGCVTREEWEEGVVALA